MFSGKRGSLSFFFFALYERRMAAGKIEQGVHASLHEKGQTWIGRTRHDGIRDTVYLFLSTASTDLNLEAGRVRVRQRERRVCLDFYGWKEEE